MIKLDWLGFFDSYIIDYLKTLREIGVITDHIISLIMKDILFLSSIILSYLLFE